MKNMSRRNVCVALPALAAVGVSVPRALAAQARSSEFPAPQSTPPAARAVPADGSAVAPVAGGGTLGAARAIGFDQMPVRAMANGGESRNIAHGTLATGESVNLHQSMQAVGAAPSPLHVIEHSEFILVREGEVEFQHELDGQVVAEKVGPGGVVYVAFGTRHAVKNVGTVPARYFVVAIGGDAK